MRLGFSSVQRMMRCAAMLASVGAAAAIQAATLAPLTTFGGGDGWRAPFELLPGDLQEFQDAGIYPYLGNAVTNTDVNLGNLERGLAYNSMTGHLLLVSRNNPTGDTPGGSVRILDATTGADIGALERGTDVLGGGFFVINMIGVAEDGAIYVGNLSLNTTTSPLKIYRWANEAATEPTVAYEGLDTMAPLSGARMGDTLDVLGSGASTRLVAGYGSTPAVAGNNSFALFTTADGLSYTGSHIAVATNPPAPGDFRLGITFTDADTVIGKQGNVPEASGGGARMVDISGTTGTLVQSILSDGQALRAMDYAVVDGRPLLVMLEATAGQIARSRIFVYDMTDPSLPVAERKIAEGSNLPLVDPVNGPNQFANVNGTGSVKFGPVTGNSVVIYAMSTNNGIQAFTLTLDPVVADSADFDDDGDVDGNDFLVWQRGLGTTGTATPMDGDANDDGNVDAADLGVWQSQFGDTGVAATVATAIPEPAGATLLCLAALAIAGRRRSR
jgi:hypothetical protein